MFINVILADKNQITVNLNRVSIIIHEGNTFTFVLKGGQVIKSIGVANFFEITSEFEVNGFKFFMSIPKGDDMVVNSSVYIRPEDVELFMYQTENLETKMSVYYLCCQGYDLIVTVDDRATFRDLMNIDEVLNE